MSEFEAYLDGEIAFAKRNLVLATAALAFFAVAGFVAARRVSSIASQKFSTQSVADQVGAVADKEFAANEASIREHISTLVPQMVASGPQSVIDGVYTYRHDLDTRIGEAMKPGDDAAIGRALDRYLATGRVDPNEDFGQVFDDAAKKKMDAIFEPISMTRDRLERIAANGKDVLPFERLTRRSIAVLLNAPWHQ